VFITIKGNIRREVLTDGYVLIGESGHASGVKAERVHNIISDVALFQDLEVVMDHVMYLFELSALNEEREEEKTVFL
jgi:hypothetical protein